MRYSFSVLPMSLQIIFSTLTLRTIQSHTYIGDTHIFFVYLLFMVNVHMQHTGADIIIINIISCSIISIIIYVQRTNLYKQVQIMLIISFCEFILKYKYTDTYLLFMHVYYGIEKLTRASRVLSPRIYIRGLFVPSVCTQQHDTNILSLSPAS